MSLKDVDYTEVERRLLRMVVKNAYDLAVAAYAAEKSIPEDKVQRYISSHLFKFTTCGAWIKFNEGGVEVGSIVEGTDVETASHTLGYPFTLGEYYSIVEQVENEARYIWSQTHGCEQCEQDGYEGEWGHVAVNPNCPVCHGRGATI